VVRAGIARLMCMALCLCRVALIVCAPPLIYALSLHDALPILPVLQKPACRQDEGEFRIRQFVGRGKVRWHQPCPPILRWIAAGEDRKSTRLNSSHVKTSDAVFCLQKKTARAGLVRIAGGDGAG